MADAEHTVQIAAKLYSMRDTARRLLGERYAAKMADYGGAIKTVAEAKNLEPLNAAMQIGKVVQAEGNDMAFLMIMAAYVEMTEPSKAVVNG